MKTEISSAQWLKEGNASDAEYHAYLERVKARFIANVGNGPVFTVQTDDMWDMYLDSFQGQYRQHHNCHACKNFIQRFGNLVTIDEHGNVTSAIWHTDDAPPHYLVAVGDMARRVRNAKITGVFYSSDKVWGQPKTGQWRHLSVTPPKAMLHTDRLLDAHQAMAAKRHDFETLERALISFSEEQLKVAMQIVSSDALYRNEKVKGVVDFLFNLKMAINTAPVHKRRAGLWLSVASAPVGYCHPRSSMVGTLLEDIEAGLPFEDIKRKFAAKMHPLKYQRPQAAPKAGNIAAAEQVVERLGIAPSLQRRFAMVEDLATVWTPRTSAAEINATKLGVFGHIEAKKEPPQHRPMGGIAANTMTWVKFRDTVLPEAIEIRVSVPMTGNFIGMTTAVDPDAPPILQWDHPDQRYPVGWYVYSGGSRAMQWGLTVGFHRVTALTLNPAHAHGRPAENHKPGLVAIIEGAEDRQSPSMCIFPETLKSELHSIRSTIEAYSKAGRLQSCKGDSACGLYGPEFIFEVRTRSIVNLYKIDRWD